MVPDNWFWLIGIESILNAVKTDVFEQPGKVAKLADSLGGDSKWWMPLSAAAMSKPGFFELLAVKAHFFMLPEPIVVFLKESSQLSITDALPEGADPTQDKWYTTSPPPTDQSATRAIMHIPGARDSFARVGCCLGRDCEADDPYDDLSIIYHEMTHAWLFLQEFSDAGIKQIYNRGAAAYQGSSGERGTPFNPHVAFSEAAGAYVQERISRWCTALWSLSEVLQNPVQVWRFTVPPTIVAKYDAPLVKPGTVKGEKITSPPMLPANLRDAIDAKILDGLPLTAKKFSDIPHFVGLRDAALGH
jgi:hypothetical protein